jgi:spore germination protein KC
LGHSGLGGGQMEKSSQRFLKTRWAIVVILLVSLLFLEGCWGKREVEQLAFVMSLGIDKGKEPGTYQITYQIARPKTSGVSGAEVENWTLSVEVSSTPKSEEKVFEIINKHPFVGTSRVIIIGEELARSGINEALDAYQRFYQFRRTIFLLLAKGKAKDILETQLRTKQLPSLSLLGTIQGQPGVSSFPVTRLGHYYTVLGREGQSPVIPTVQKVRSSEKGVTYSDKEGEELQIEGAGVFTDGKLVGFLNDEESKGYLWLNNEVTNRFIETPEEKGLKLSAWVLETKTKYKFQPIEDKMGITFQIKADVSLNEIIGQQGVMDPEEWRNFILEQEPIVAQVIERECQAAVRKSKELHADFIGIGRKLEQKEPQYWKEVKDNWENELVDFPVSFDIQVVIEHTGLARNAPTSPQRSGQE